MGLFGRFRKGGGEATGKRNAPGGSAAPTPGRLTSRQTDALYGTGLWRQHRDRFNRAVDRFYSAAVAVHSAVDSSPTTGPSDTPAPSSTASPSDLTTPDDLTAPSDSMGDPTAASAAAEALAHLTLTFNDLGTRVDAISAWAHAHVPVKDLVVPAAVRAVVGDLSEKLTKAAHFVAQSAMTAAMTRAALRDGSNPLTSTRAAQRCAANATALVVECEAIVAASHPGDGTA